MTIELKSPIMIGEEKFTTFTVSPLTFVKFAKVAQRAVDNATEKETYQVLLKRYRLQSQIMLDGRKNLGDLDVFQMSIKNAKLMIEHMEKEIGAQGEIISKDADGIGKSIVYKLGTPVVTANSTISELEFMAETYGQIENVLCEDSVVDRATALIRHVAKPAGMNLMPEWIVDAISFSDGIKIARDILPNFTN